MRKVTVIDVPDPRILCVDSDRRTTDWIKDVLRNARTTTSVTAVRTGREAFAMLMRREFDLCILDYALPDMTGPQLCGLMRHAGCEIPTVIFTAMDRPVDRRRSIECGVDAFLVKPDDLGIFHSTIVRLLDRRRPILLPDSKLIGLSRAA